MRNFYSLTEERFRVPDNGLYIIGASEHGCSPRVSSAATSEEIAEEVPQSPRFCGLR